MVVGLGHDDASVVEQDAASGTTPRLERARGIAAVVGDALPVVHLTLST
jgi:hypothetical protein